MGAKSMKKSMKKAPMKKAMKAKKARKAKKAKRVSIIAKGRGAKARVWSGAKVKTGGGLKKSSLCKNKHGKIVSKKLSAQGKKAYKNISKFAQATKAARKALGIKGFVPVGGKTAKGQALLKKVRSLYRKEMSKEEI